VEATAGDKKPLPMILIKRATIFLFVVCVVSTFYWIVGSLSSYLDATQAMLVRMMTLSSSAVIIASGLGLLVELAYAVAGRYRASVLGIIGYIGASALSLASLIVAQSVSLLSTGLR
jgi:hypothetical protein